MKKTFYVVLSGFDERTHEFDAYEIDHFEAITATEAEAISLVQKLVDETIQTNQNNGVGCSGPFTLIDEDDRCKGAIHIDTGYVDTWYYYRSYEIETD